MERQFIVLRNIIRFEEALKNEADPAKREVLQKQLAEEKAKQVGLKR